MWKRRLRLVDSRSCLSCLLTGFRFYFSLSGFSPLCVIEDVLHSFHSATFSPFLLQSSREKCASLFSDLDLAGVEPSILCHGSIFILCLNSPVERQNSCVGTTVSDEKLKAEQRDIQNNQKCWTDDVCWNNIDSGDFPGCGCTDETALKTLTYIICPPRKYKEIVMTSLKTEIHWRTCKIYKCCSPVYEH